MFVRVYVERKMSEMFVKQTETLRFFNESSLGLLLHFNLQNST